MRIDTPTPNVLTSSFVPLRDSLRVIFGLNHLSCAEREQILYFNLFGGGLLAIFTCVIEVWMLVQSFVSAQNPEVVARVGWDWIVQHRIAYVIQFLSALVFLVAALYKYVHGRINSTAAGIVLGQFVVVCVVFGVFISLRDVSRGHAVYALLTMLVAISCIFSIRPILFVPAALVSLGIVMNFAGHLGLLSRGDATNLIIFLVTITISSCMRYYTTIRIARTSIDFSERLREDALTGLGNVAAMRSDLALLEGGDATVTILDINDFKLCNDRLGHVRGNTAIVLLARTLEDYFENVGQSYRVGGDEFMVMTTALPRDEHERRVGMVAATFERSCEIGGLVVDGRPLTVATGTAAGPMLDGRDFDLLFQRADEAMYQQKHSQP